MYDDYWPSWPSESLLISDTDSRGSYSYIHYLYKDRQLALALIVLFWAVAKCTNRLPVHNNGYRVVCAKII